jgi:hypothetical protein
VYQSFGSKEVARATISVRSSVGPDERELGADAVDRVGAERQAQRRLGGRDGVDDGARRLRRVTLLGIADLSCERARRSDGLCIHVELCEPVMNQTLDCVSLPAETDVLVLMAISFDK